MPRRPIPRLSLPGSPAGLVLHETRVRGPLGRAVALVADVVDPGRVILAGAAFTDDPGALRHVAAALHRHSPVRRDVRVSRARGRITRDAAAAVALDALHADPLAVAAAPAPPDRPRSRPAPAPPPGRPRAAPGPPPPGERA
ncbi:hypothetical protein [Corynebacterium sp. 335C]